MRCPPPSALGSVVALFLVLNFWIFEPCSSLSGRTVLPGRLTLLLGHPGCGKSILLKALTHRLANPSSLKGEVQYNGRSALQVAADGACLGQLVQYVNQLDEHFAFLTVRETLMFVAENCLAGVDKAGAAERVQEVLNLLHLNGCANTMIGNDILRGVSGGEKKRVTVGEGILTNARFLAMDGELPSLPSALVVLPKWGHSVLLPHALQRSAQALTRA